MTFGHAEDALAGVLHNLLPILPFDSVDLRGRGRGREGEDEAVTLLVVMVRVHHATGKLALAADDVLQLHLLLIFIERTLVGPRLAVYVVREEVAVVLEMFEVYKLTHACVVGAAYRDVGHFT